MGPAGAGDAAVVSRPRFTGTFGKQVSDEGREGRARRERLISSVLVHSVRSARSRRSSATNTPTASRFLASHLPSVQRENATSCFVVPVRRSSAGMALAERLVELLKSVRGMMPPRSGPDVGGFATRVIKIHKTASGIILG